jgi:hypothetical protein
LLGSFNSKEKEKSTYIPRTNTTGEEIEREGS